MSTATTVPRAGAATLPALRRGTYAGLAALLVLVAAVGVLSLAIGSRHLGLATTVRVLFHPDAPGFADASAIVHSLRLPRTVLAISVGGCLGVAGALMQGHTRNPLAEPGLLGVSNGSALAVVVGIFVFGVTSVSGYAWFALLGAGVAAAAVFAIGSTRGGPSPVSLVLAGTAVSALFASFTQAIVVRDATTLDKYRFWVIGSASGRDLGVFWQVLPFMVAGLLLAAVSTPGLNLLQLGDDVARSLGMNPLRHKILGLLAVMLLTGAATAACGPIAFLGLVVPHVARFLTGPDHRWLVPYAGLIGALLLTVADVVGRVVVPPAELQVGIVMSLLGGPAFVVLVRRTRMVRP